MATNIVLPILVILLHTSVSTVLDHLHESTPINTFKKNITHIIQSVFVTPDAVYCLDKLPYLISYQEDIRAEPETRFMKTNRRLCLKASFHNIYRFCCSVLEL